MAEGVSITEDAIIRLNSAFSCMSAEQGVLLGCSQGSNKIDTVEIVPTESTCKDGMVIDSIATEQVIDVWEKTKINFCGFLHSHVGGCRCFSREDKAFAAMLIKNFGLHLLWFGLVTGDSDKRLLELYAVSFAKNEMQFVPKLEILLNC